ncbi:alpha/beta hydrolase [Candidatus Hydrogenedentota bacterium]
MYWKKAMIVAGILCLYCVLGCAGVQKTPSPGAGTVKTEVYRTTPQGDLSLDIHFPDDWRTDDKRPAIVFFFGGGWSGGNATHFEPQAKYIASRGMVTIRPDYRVFGQERVNPDECVRDAMAAMRWVRAHARELGIDPDRIVSSGGSAGGHLAACMGVGVSIKGDGDNLDVPYKSNAMVLFNPALDMMAVLEMRKKKKVAVVSKLKWQLDAETARKISPQHHVTKGAPPAVLFFGTEDFLLDQLDPFVREMEKKGNKAEVYMAEGEKHSFFNWSPWREKTMRRMDEFLARLGYLECAPTIVVPDNPSEAKPKARR